jgi:hypothetical protein
MDKIQARVHSDKWRQIKARLKAKTNQEAIEMLISNQLQRWAVFDTNNDSIRRLNEKLKQEKGES